MLLFLLSRRNFGDVFVYCSLGTSTVSFCLTSGHFDFNFFSKQQDPKKMSAELQTAVGNELKHACDVSQQARLV